MRVTITGTPMFSFTLSLVDVGNFAELSRLHYDAACRDLSAHAGQGGSRNGLLTIWGHSLQGPDPSWDNVNVEAPAGYPITGRQVQLLLKLLEFPARQTVDPQWVETQRTLLLAALKLAAAQNWEVAL